MNYKLFLFIIILFLSSCTLKKNRTENGNYIKINASLSTEEIFPESQYSINTKLIPLETTQECLIGDIQTILYRNNRFYIKSYRDNRILTFNQNGKFVGKLDLVGRGPGEYLQFNDFIVDSVNNIYILDMFEIKKYNH